MIIPLEDPLWSRLYGPYGVRSVSANLKQLKTEWDDDLAKELFWEELHHQGDLYPVTYAALPWLWTICQQMPSPPREALFFFSHILSCAVAAHGTGCDGQGPRGKHRGLDLRPENHKHSWIPLESHLTKDDMVSLGQLESWFDDNALPIAEACVSAAEPQDSRENAAALSKGWIALSGTDTVVLAVTMWADGHPIDDIIDETQPDPSDKLVARELSGQFTDLSPVLSEFLESFAKT